MPETTNQPPNQAHEQEPPELETLCEYCDGTGRARADDCEHCDGAGYVPTPLGERFLDLMEHNFRAMLKRVAS